MIIVEVYHLYYIYVDIYNEHKKSIYSVSNVLGVLLIVLDKICENDINTENIKSYDFIFFDIIKVNFDAFKA